MAWVIVMYNLIALIVGYLFGNILCAFIVCKIKFGMNPTQIGSHNPGTANVGSIFGKKWGLLTCVGDIVKAILAFILVLIVCPMHIFLAYCGLGLMLGHAFPFWNKFNGGKCVAVSLPIVIFFDWQWGIFCIIIELLLMIILKNLAVSPVISLLIYSIAMFVIYSNCAGILFFIGWCVMLYKFRNDLVAYCKGKGKRTDILFLFKRVLKHK